MIDIGYFDFRFVLNHYRPPTNFWGCVKSIFYLHNETVNILTHGESSIYYYSARWIQQPWI